MVRKLLNKISKFSSWAATAITVATLPTTPGSEPMHSRGSKLFHTQEVHNLAQAFEVVDDSGRQDDVLRIDLMTTESDAERRGHSVLLLGHSNSSQRA